MRTPMFAASIAARPILASLACAFALLASAACQSVRSLREPVTLAELPRTEHAVVLDVPPILQDDLYECGLACVASLCSYYEVEIPPGERAELARRALENEGLRGAELREALNALGLRAFLVRGTLDRAATGLYGSIDRSRPVLVLLGSGAEDAHYCLFTGYDESVDAVYVIDPALGARRMSGDEFTALWDGAQRFALIAVPHASGVLPAAATRVRSSPSLANTKELP